MTKYLRALSAPAVFLFLLYCAVIGWLHHADIYHRHFSESGGIVALYNLARLAFMCGLMWLIYFAGWGVLRLAAGTAGIAALPALSRIILGFFAGSGVWHIVLFIVGLLGLYTFPVAVLLTISVLLLSLPHLSDNLKHIALPKEHPQAVIVFSLAALAFIAAKIIYPGGWHDYFTHYFYYYREVVDSGSIAPNAVWYHFFYCKGLGLYFLSMLLTDPLAPQLVAGGHVLAAAAIVYALTKRATGGLWPWIACTLYLALQVYIRGAGYGSWGQLPKTHELTSALTLALLWCVVTLPPEKDKSRKAWLIAMPLIVAATLLVTVVMGIVQAGFLCLMAAWWRRERGLRRAAMDVFPSLCVAGFGTVAMFLYNYLVTGIPYEQLLVPAWPYLLMDKMRHWGIVFEATMMHEEHSGMFGSPVLLRSGFLFLWRCFRLDLLYPLLAFAALCALWKKQRIAASRDWPCYALFFGLCTTLALVAGRSEPVSFYRLSSFMFAPMLCFVMIAVGTSAHTLKPKLAAAVACLCVILAYAQYKANDLTATAEGSWRFMTGGYSIDDALSRQRGLPGDARAEGAIHPAARAAYYIAGPNTRIWTFNPYTYCMLPDCRMESHISFRFSPNVEQILFGKAELAKRILQLEGLDYFLITPSLGIRDPLPVSDLFRPEHIAQHLAVAWTDGDAALLTWPDAHTAPISQDWLARYRKAVAESDTVARFRVKEMQAFFRQAKEGRHPPPLPWMQ